MKRPGDVDAERGDPPCAEIGEPLCMALLATAKVILERVEEALKAVGLSRAKMETLDQLVRADEPMSLRALAEGQRCVPSNMTTLIDRLEREGLVRRVEHPTDRRKVRAELTPSGAERAAAGAEVLGRVQEEFAASLPPSDRGRLRQILSSLHRDYPNEPGAAAPSSTSP